MLAVAESWENGKPVRETLAADIPLAADHFRYFASVIRGEEGSISEIDKARSRITSRSRSESSARSSRSTSRSSWRPGSWPRHSRRATPSFEAGESYAVVDPQADGGARRDRAGRRHQRRQRPRCGDRQGPCDQQEDLEDRVHRRDGDGAADHAVRRAEHHPVDDRARWQVAEHLLRRRDGARGRLPRQGHRRAGSLRLQQGRGLHVSFPGTRRGSIYDEFMDRASSELPRFDKVIRSIRRPRSAPRSRPHNSRRSRATSRSARAREPSS